MKIVRSIYRHFTQNLTFRKATAVVLGNFIIGVAVAGLVYTLLGSDPFTAMNMAISGGLGMGLGNYQLIINGMLFLIQFTWGRSYIGFGSIVNMCFSGYVIEYSGYGLHMLLGAPEQYTFVQRFLMLLVSLVVLSFGVSMYQTASIGVSPYDFMALGLTARFKTKYFINRVGTDVSCVLVILIAVFSGFITWDNCQLGIGTICVAFFMGPLIDAFNGIHEKWVR